MLDYDCHKIRPEDCKECILAISHPLVDLSKLDILLHFAVALFSLARRVLTLPYSLSSVLAFSPFHLFSTVLDFLLEKICLPGMHWWGLSAL